MNKWMERQTGWLCGAFLMLTLCGCGSQKTVVKPQAAHYQLTGLTDERIEIDARFDRNPNQKAVDLLKLYKLKVDSIMSPVIGESTHFMKASVPESDLSNLVADALLWGAQRYSSTPVDMALSNQGGIRSSLPAGPITYGNIFEITPFENTLVLMQLNGAQMLRLFKQLYKIKDGCVAGVSFTFTKDGELKEAKIGGKPVDESRNYTLATIDYLAEGNDGYEILKEGRNQTMPDGATLRQLFLDYVYEQTRLGKKLDTQVEGRFIIEK